jgi:hypothetical protein
LAATVRRFRGKGNDALDFTRSIELVVVQGVDTGVRLVVGEEPVAGSMCWLSASLGQASV